MVVRTAQISFGVAGVSPRPGNGRASVADAVGAVYTPPALADWTASQLLRHTPRKAVLRVLDPACGAGDLLAGVVRSCDDLVEVCGRDIDPRALAAAAQALRVPVDLALGDSLRSESLEELPWPPDAVIMNPPWNGLEAKSRHELRVAGYELAKGQFDLYEIFVERVVKLFSNIPMAFILPDSVFLPEHTRFRRFLLQNTQPLFMARLGEGLFPGVYRGTFVMVLRGGQGDHGNVECFRLRAAERKAFMTGTMSLEDFRESQSHDVPLSRFAANPNAEFTLDVRSDESAVDRMMRVSTIDWDHVFWIGRGVEIGKNGTMLRCGTCSTYRPAPRRQYIVSLYCPSCGTVFPSDAGVHYVVRRRNATDDPSWRRIIVGEDVDRYLCHPSRELRLGLLGIQYKDVELAMMPKLLVRKTGVGLRAAVDRSGSLTLQTVFHFIVKLGIPSSVLDYMAGVLNSRVMLAFHLRWSGDIEWRSHTYITPTIIKALPVPTPFIAGTAMSRVAEEVATLARRRSCGEMVEEQIEDLVVDLYGLTSLERQWVRDVIGSAQALRGISELREPLRAPSLRGCDDPE